jgi:putative transposase
MPRQARIDAPGALHHVIVRGIERRRIFQDDQDRDQFLNRLGEILPETATPCYAWVLLPNHVHLLLRTGRVPIATVMRRLLTGYAVTYNRRHRRHGQLFQNRYKSILCQEDPYLLELVRYIHLNPLRAKIVPDLDGLESYPYAGHHVVLGKEKNSWQDVDAVLSRFGGRAGTARRRYREFVREGVKEGRRPELVRGGVKRGMGGWKGVGDRKEEPDRIKGDERILGESDFIEEVLRASEEEMERKYRLRAQGYDLEKVVRRVGEVMGMEPERIWARGRYAELVEARSLLCYWAVREVGMSATELARRFAMTQPAVSISVKRGEDLANAKGLRLLDK